MCWADMTRLLRRIREDVPLEFLAALVVATAFATVLVLDQMYWWQLKPEYMFGWLVPLFVGFVVMDRWPKITAALRGGGESPLPAGLRRMLEAFFGMMMAVGAVFFPPRGALSCRLGRDPARIARLGDRFCGALAGHGVFAAPQGRVGENPVPAGWRALGGMRGFAWCRCSSSRL